MGTMTNGMIQSGFQGSLQRLLAFGLLVSLTHAAHADAIGNPNPANGWSSAGAITVTASSSHAARPAIRTIDGSGVDTGGSLHQGSDVVTGSPGPYMWMSGPMTTAVSRGGTVSGSHWIEFRFDQVYDLGQMWIWNYNEKPNDWTIQGMKEVTIQYSVSGGSGPADWGTIHDGQIPKTSVWIPEASPWYTPVALVVDFAGAQARFVVITADFGTERNWAGGGPGANEVGLSEVRFFTFSPPAFSAVQVGSRTGLAFQSMNGTVYRPEFAMPAAPTNWTGMGFTLLGSGSQMFAFDPAGYSTQKLYRIVREE